MSGVRIGIAAALAASLAACGPRPQPQPQPQPVPQPAPRPQPVPPPPPPATAWMDARLSPGGWVYRTEGNVSIATFGPAGAPSFIVRCEASRQVTLARAGAATGPLTIRTSQVSRSLAAQAMGGGLGATVTARDPLLDAIAFSRGRFAVEAPGAAQLIVPAWPEPARVIEDCRS